MPSLFCPDAAPTLFGFFDFSLAPSLLFYAYIPAIAVSLLTGWFVVTRDHYSTASKLLAGIAVSFALWTFNIFFQWIAAPVEAVMLAWQLTAIFESGIFIFTVYFVLEFTGETSATFKQKLLLLVPALPVLLLVPTSLNVTAFDIANCEGVLGPLWIYLYGLEIFGVLAVLALGGYRYVRAATQEKQGQIRNITIGAVLFMSIFTASNVVGELTKSYEINLVGPGGMLLFVGFLAYMIVRFKSFSSKLVATDVLVWSLCILIASEFFFVKERANFILVGATLSIAVVFGFVLARSVRREVKQREKLQILSEELQKANTDLQDLSRFKTQLLSLASHQIKAPLAAIKGYISLMLEGGYGAVPANLAKPLGAMQHSADGLVDLVLSLLDLRKIEEGKMEYTFDRVDVAELVRDVVDELGMLAREKKLELTLTGAENPVYVRADRTKLKQVAQNLVDNSIKYTPTGSVNVVMKTDGRFVTCTVSDTGLGMAPSLLPHLFDEFTRDQRVQRTIRGTGLGLYIAKRIIEAHGGTVEAGSPGEGLGSQFWFTLPTAQ